MPKWAKTDGSFVAGDVIRWREPVWKKAKRGKKRPVRIGERRISGEVKGEDAKGFLSLRVLKCEILDNPFAGDLKPLEEGEIVRRKRGTIEKGNPERLKWSEESARTLAASRFLR